MHCAHDDCVEVVGQGEQPTMAKLRLTGHDECMDVTMDCSWAVALMIVRLVFFGGEPFQ
jgi:hypothetical protein